MGNDLKLICFLSGRGSNFKSLIEKCKSANFVAVISDKPEAAGLEIAREANIPICVVDRKLFSSKRDFNRELLKRTLEFAPDLLILAGYMRILPSFFIENFENKIINIHPSLLPLYPGLDCHSRVLEAGDKEHGCSIHIVDKGLDSGQLIAQAAIEVLENDDSLSLANRLLKKEHLIYPWVLEQILSGEIILDKKIRYSTKAMQSANDLKIQLHGELIDD